MNEDGGRCFPFWGDFTIGPTGVQDTQHYLVIGLQLFPSPIAYPVWSRGGVTVHLLEYSFQLRERNGVLQDISSLRVLPKGEGGCSCGSSFPRIIVFRPEEPVHLFYWHLASLGLWRFPHTIHTFARSPVVQALEVGHPGDGPVPPCLWPPYIWVSFRAFPSLLTLLTGILPPLLRLSPCPGLLGGVSLLSLR